MDRAKAIKIALLRAGLTQVDIAKKCGVNRTAVNQVIHNRIKSKKIEAELEQVLIKFGAAV